MSPTQIAALKALIDHGGEGVMTKTGTMLARGVELGHGPDGEGSREEGYEVDFFQRSTWRALLELKMIEEIASRRFRAVISDTNCPGHVASEANAKICRRCGIHIDDLRPPEDYLT